MAIVGIWLDTPFDGGRHARRLDKIKRSKSSFQTEHPRIRPGPLRPVPKTGRRTRSCLILRKDPRPSAEQVEGNNAWRQKECFNLIPSESTPSLLVKMCEISDPAGRYAEHRTMKGEEVYFYQGIDFIRDVEVEAQRELGRYFGCTDVELRPVSGQMANEVVFKGVVKFLNRGKAEGAAVAAGCAWS